jgi:hypothetical protein
MTDVYLVHDSSIFNEPVMWFGRHEGQSMAKVMEYV